MRVLQRKVAAAAIEKFGSTAAAPNSNDDTNNNDDGDGDGDDSDNDTKRLSSNYLRQKNWLTNFRISLRNYRK